ncbi:hypothetical protein, partial [Klebsiella pneumoniae]|uniref:hypothetical protein n=1 Tax=Klebsiella pneumoniae TaxID=573 RepID=UPI001C644EAB
MPSFLLPLPSESPSVAPGYPINNIFAMQNVRSLLKAACQRGQSPLPQPRGTKNHLNEWKGLPLIMRLINSCAIMGYTSSR